MRIERFSCQSDIARPCSRTIYEQSCCCKPWPSFSGAFSVENTETCGNLSRNKHGNSLRGAMFVAVSWKVHRYWFKMGLPCALRAAVVPGLKSELFSSQARQNSQIKSQNSRFSVPWHLFPVPSVGNLIFSAPFQSTGDAKRSDEMRRDDFWPAFATGAVVGTIAGIGGVLVFKRLSSGTDKHIIRLKKKHQHRPSGRGGFRRVVELRAPAPAY